MPAAETTRPFPWCMHKDHDEWWDVTRQMDRERVYLAPCGGIRCEPRD